MFTIYKKIISTQRNLPDDEDKEYIYSEVEDQVEYQCNFQNVDQDDNQ